ncbi:MAG: hypothetical protein ACJA1L_003735 [Paracoccaceae bacterium]|jgi:uncharacterized protein YbaR (Trm112 family)
MTDADKDEPMIPHEAAKAHPEAEAPPAQIDARRMTVERRMLESLVCPLTQGRLDWDRNRQELISRQARLAFPVRDGIPIMLASEARAIDD